MVTMDSAPTAKDYMRFLSKIAVRGPDECWPWIAQATSKNGRGSFGFGGAGKCVTAPSWALQWLGGVALEGRWALHTCHNAACCNPSHLYAGDREDNTRDMVAAGRARRVGARSDDFIRALRRAHAAGESISSLARKMRKNLQWMQDVIHRRKYRFVSE